MLRVRWVLSLALCVSPCVLAQPAPASSTLSIPYEMFTLENGLRVILHQDRRLPVVAVDAWYHAGIGPRGAGPHRLRAPASSASCFEGSENVPEGMFDRWLEAAGGKHQRDSTSNDRTNYVRDAPSNALDAGAVPGGRPHGLRCSTRWPARRRWTASATW